MIFIPLLSAPYKNDKNHFRFIIHTVTCDVEYIKEHRLT